MWLMFLLFSFFLVHVHPPHLHVGVCIMFFVHVCKFMIYGILLHFCIFLLFVLLVAISKISKESSWVEKHNQHVNVIKLFTVLQIYLQYILFSGPLVALIFSLPYTRPQTRNVTFSVPRRPVHQDVDHVPHRRRRLRRDSEPWWWNRVETAWPATNPADRTSP